MYDVNELEKEASIAKHRYSILETKLKIAKKLAEIEELKNNVSHYEKLLKEKE